MIRTKRIYKAASADDGYRVLVDRLRPRGLRKEAPAVDALLKNTAPSDGLRKWLGSEGATYAEFARRYRRKLEAPRLAPLLADLQAQARHGSVTLLYAKPDRTEHNAEVLKAVLTCTPIPDRLAAGD
jgi:uncharacterized protein YeaO (DUF488 family)